MAQAIHRNALAAGYQLHWYEIERVLGQGGFGITYLARDSNLDQQVAIKEYLPAELAMRESDFSVLPVATDREEHFRLGLRDFLTEAQTLVRFDHPNIVRVHSVFEANNTAYMVMRYEDGKSLSELIRRRGTLDESALMNILSPILDGLSLVHGAGFIHRDIKPSNVFVRDDGSPVLLDFGSAREALGKATRTLTSLVTPGYAPFEQYASRGDKQGPWTDIYGLGALLYRAMFGRAPIDAMDRSDALLSNERDPIVSAVEAGADSYTMSLCLAVDLALAFRPEDRPQTIQEWSGLLPGGKRGAANPAVARRAVSVPAPDQALESFFPTIEFPEEPAVKQTDSNVAEPAGWESATAVAPDNTTRPELAAQAPMHDDAPMALPFVALLSSFLDGPARAYYLDRFLPWHEAGKLPPWSWNKAGLLGPLWLLYRRMPLWALIIQPVIAVLLTLASTALVVYLFTKFADHKLLIASGFFALWLFVLPAAYGNWIYYRQAISRIEQARQFFKLGDEQRAWLGKRGAVSRVQPVVFVLTAVLVCAGFAKQPRDYLRGVIRGFSTESLLADARRDVAALRLDAPAGNNATEKLQSLLAREPGNSDALALRDELVASYKALGKEAARQKKPALARRYFEKALLLAPEDVELLRAKKRLRQILAQ